MPVSLGDIILYFRGDDSDLNATFDLVERRADQVGQQVGNVLTRTITGGLRGIAGALQGAFTLFTSNLLLMAVERVGAAFEGLRQGMVGGNAAFEDYNVRFTTLLKSADLAQERMAALAQFGATTPFELPQVVDADVVIQGFGLHSEEAAKKFGFAGEQIRQIAGDVASGSGVAFNEMARYLGQFSAGSTGEALARFAELGVVTRQQLSEMGVQFSKSGELVSPLPQAMNVLLTYMQQKYGGLMEAQSMTFNGMMSNLSDWFAGVARLAGQPLFAGLQQSLGILLQFLNGPEMQGAVQSLAAGMQSLVDTVGRAISAIMPIAATVAGVMIPLVQLGAEWGRGFTEAFASGIQMAANVVGEALGGIASVVTGLLQPHSPPKILPDLDKWGMLTAQTWMDGWKQADYKVFSDIAKSAQTALQVAVGRRQLGESQIPGLLNATRNAVAETIQTWREHGRVSEDSLNRVRQAAGPAGEQVVALTRAYLDAEQATRATAEAQDALNDITAQYDAILNPLNSQLDSVQRQMDQLNANKQLAQIEAKLRSGDLGGEDRQMLQLQKQQIQLRQNINTQQAAKKAATDEAKARLEAAKKAEDAAKAQLEAQKASLDTQKEALDLAKQQAASLNSLAKSSAGAGAAMKSAGQAQQQVNEAVQQARQRAKELQEQYQQLKTRLEESFARGRAIVQPIIDALQRLAQTARILRRAFTEETGTAQFATDMGQLARILGAPAEVISRIVLTLRNLAAAFRVGAEAGGVLGGLAQMLYRFGPVSPIFIAIGDAFARLGTVVDRLRTSLQAGTIRVDLLALGSSLVAELGGLVRQGIQGLIGMIPAELRARMPTLAGLLAGAFVGLRVAPIVNAIAGPIGAGLVTLGSVAGSVFGALAAAASLAAGPIGQVLGVMRTGILAAVAALQAGGWAGIVAFFRSLGPLLANPALLLQRLGAAAIAAIAPLIQFGTAFQSRVLVMLAAIRSGGIGAVVLGFFRSIAAVIRNPTQLIQALGAAFAALRQPITLLQGLGAALLGLRGPAAVVLGLGRGLLGLLSPVNLVITAISLFAGAWAENFGGIQQVVRSTLAPVLPLLEQFGAVLLGFGRALLGGDIRGALGQLQSGMAGLQPLLRSAAASLQAGLPQIATILGRFLRLTAESLIATIRTYVPPILATLGTWARAFLAWVGPLIGPLLVQLGNVLGSVLDWIGQQLPPLIDALGKWAGALIVWAINALPRLIANLALLLAGILAWIVQRAPAIGLQLLLWTGQFAGWVLTSALPALIGALGSLIGQFLAWITGSGSSIGTEINASWGQQLSAWVAGAIGPLFAQLGTLIGQLGSWISQNGPTLLDQLGVWANQFAAWIPGALAQLGAGLNDLITSMGTWIVQNGPGLLQQLGTWATQFAAWIPGALGQLIMGLGTLYGQFLGWIVQNGPGLLQQLSTWSQQFNTWIGQLSVQLGQWIITTLLPAFVRALGQLATDAWNGFVTLWNNAWKPGSLGAQIITNLRQGIQDNWNSLLTWVGQKVAELAARFDPRNWFGGGAPAPAPAPVPATASPAPANTPARPASTPAPSTTTRPAATRSLPGRARGGPVAPPNAYWTGEEGPEVFVPTMPGTILPTNLVDRLSSVLAGSAGSAGPTSVGAGAVTVMAPVSLVIQGNVDSPQRVQSLVRELEAAMSKRIYEAIMTIVQGGIKSA